MLAVKCVVRHAPKEGLLVERGTAIFRASLVAILGALHLLDDGPPPLARVEARRVLVSVLVVGSFSAADGMQGQQRRLPESEQNHFHGVLRVFEPARVAACAAKQTRRSVGRPIRLFYFVL